MLASDFGALTTPHEVTQYLRGRLYLYVDFLLANEYKEPEKEIGPVTDFFRLATKLVAKWLGHFPDLLRPVQHSVTICNVVCGGDEQS